MLQTGQAQHIQHACPIEKRTANNTVAYCRKTLTTSRHLSCPSFPPFYYYLHICKRVFLALRHFFLFRPRVFPRAMGSVACREPARTPHASLGPGRSPWHVLWGFEVASPLGEGFRARIAIQAHANPRTGSKNVRRL